MKTQNLLQKMISSFLLVTLAFSVVQPGLVDSALAQSAPDENIAYDPLTGALAFVGTQPGAAMASPLMNPLSKGAAVNAGAFASTYGEQLGLHDVSSELTVAQTFVEAGGRSTVRYEQNYQGIPVVGGETIVNTDANGAMLSLSAKISPNLDLDINPTLTADAAATAAIEAIARDNKVSPRGLTAGQASLQIYDARLLGVADVAPRLVWSVTISNLPQGINEQTLVDAHTGAIALHYNQVDVVNRSSALDVAPVGVHPEVLGVPFIEIYDMEHQFPPIDGIGWPGTYICNHADKTPCDGIGGDDPDAVNAYKNALDGYNFMKNYLKIDSFNNAGSVSGASIHYGNGYKKNVWISGVFSDQYNGNYTGIAVYGDNYTSTDDMAGHAIALGILKESSAARLGVYGYQSASIVGSLADMWGEFIDQTNGRGTDTAAVKWIIGEDWPDGPQRSMSNPAAAPYNAADKMSSPNFYLGADPSAGTYINAGVNNKAVYLMTDGGTFNGKTVTGLGLAKVSRIYYEAEKHLLGSASTYFDLYYAVKQACYNLVASSQGIAAQDCDQVRNALDAVQMNLTKSASVYPVATFCPPGKSKGSSSLFFDDFENGPGKWTFLNSSNPAPSYQWSIAVDNARVGSSTGLYHLQAFDRVDVSKAIAETTNPILIPAGHSVYLFFEHWFSFQTTGATNNDGGILYYSPDNGATWKSIAPLFASGKNYNGTIATGTGSPIAGQSAFVGSVNIFTSSSYNLTSLAGKQVKFRWIMASDSTGAGVGWGLDNVQVYPCVSLPSVPALVSPATNALQMSFKPTLDWSDAAPDVDHYVVQVSTNTAFTALVYQATVKASINTLTKYLTPNRLYYWRVRAYNAANDGSAWSAVRTFRTVLAAPTLQSPITGKSASLRPTFNWTDVSGAKGYTIQVSGVPTFAALTFNVTIATATSQFTPTASLITKKLYYWRVRTNGTNGPSSWSAVKSFTTP